MYSTVSYAVLQVDCSGSARSFLDGLQQPEDSRALAKVVTVVGNPGEGKSHLLNQVFFGGQEVFR